MPWIANCIGIVWIFDLTPTHCGKCKVMNMIEDNWVFRSFQRKDTMLRHSRRKKTCVEYTVFASVTLYDRHLSVYFITITVIIIPINWRQSNGFRRSLHTCNYNSPSQWSVAKDKQCRFNDIDGILLLVRGRCNVLQHLLLSHGYIAKRRQTDNDIAMFS